MPEKYRPYIIEYVEQAKREYLQHYDITRDLTFSDFLKTKATLELAKK